MGPFIATMRCARGLRPSASALRRCAPNVKLTSSRAAHLLVGCYTNDHEPLAYYTNTATDKGAYVIDLDTTDGSLSLLDVSSPPSPFLLRQLCPRTETLTERCLRLQGPVAAGTNPTYAAYDSAKGCAYFTNENLEDGCIKAFSLSPQGKLSPMNSAPIPDGW